LVDAFLGNISAWGDMQSYGLDNSYASLYPVTGDDLPDNSFSEIPYEKGFQFLHFLESLMGEDNFQELLRLHINHHHRSSINYSAFQKLTTQYINVTYDNETAAAMNAKIDWDAWVRGPGLAPVQLDFTTPKLLESQGIADEYIALNGTSPANYEAFFGYFSSL